MATKLTETHKENLGIAQRKRFSDPQQREKMRQALLNFYSKHPEHRDMIRTKNSKLNVGRKTPLLIFHHTKYLEIHGYDEGVWLTQSEHKKLHARLRKTGKCNIPSEKLHSISHAARWRRLHGRGVTIILPRDKVVIDEINI